jgi:hypothetical protein
MKKFQVGDRVVCKGHVGNYHLSDAVGTVVKYDNYFVGVSFDENINGHDCDGTATHLHGWWCDPSLIDIATPIVKFNEKEYKKLLDK